MSLHNQLEMLAIPPPLLPDMLTLCFTTSSLQTNDLTWNCLVFKPNTSIYWTMRSTEDVPGDGPSTIDSAEAGVGHSISQRTIGTEVAQEKEASPEVTQEEKKEEEEEEIEEGTASYRPGHFHPVYIGDVYHEKYQVLNKIGYGQYSTVWPVKDISTL